MKQKYLYLFKNSFWFFVSSFGTSLISFFLTPIYTIVFKKGELGLVDVLEFTALLLFYIVSLDFSDVVARYSLDDSLNKPMILKIGLEFLFKSGIVVSFIVAILCTINIFHWDRIYYLFLIVQYIILSLNLILSQYLKGLGKVNIIALSGVVSIIFRLLLVLILLVFFKTGIKGYFIASFVSGLISIFICILNIDELGNVYKIKIIKSVEKEMLVYAIPTAINALGWWVAQGIDKYFVSYFFGYDLNGIYSVSYKLPSIISIVCTVFTSAFSISAVKELNDSRGKEFFKKTYTLFVSILNISCSILIILNVFMTDILFAEEYFGAWRYSSFLIVSSLFSGLGSYIGGLCDALKRNKVLAFSTITSAFVNIILNMLLIPSYEAVGAAISTTISMFIIFAVRFFYIEKYIIIHNKLYFDVISFVLLCVQIVLNQMNDHNYLLQAVILLLIITLRLPDLREVIKRGR